MSVYCIKCLMFTKKKKRRTDQKVDIYSRCNCNFKSSATLNEEKVTELSKNF